MVDDHKLAPATMEDEKCVERSDSRWPVGNSETFDEENLTTWMSSKTRRETFLSAKKEGSLTTEIGKGYRVYRQNDGAYRSSGASVPNTQACWSVVFFRGIIITAFDRRRDLRAYKRSCAKDPA